MRIALIAPFGLRPKGTARARALPLARALAARGHNVALFVPPYDNPEDSGLTWTDGGVTILNAPLPGHGTPGAFGQLRLGWRLLVLVRNWHPDVVHCFKPKGPSGLAATGLWLGRRERRPLLVIDADDWEGPGGWNDDPRTGYSSLQKRFFAWQERYGLSHADAWTVTSACLRDRVLALGGRRERVFHLPNGITATPVQPAPWPTRPTAVLYTRFAGTRPADVLAIWERIRAQVPEATLIVIGQGLAGEERRLAGVAGVQVAGWIGPERLGEWLAGAAVALVPWADTLPNRARHSAKVLELMAAGRAIVASAVGELPATLGDTGILLPPGDAKAFADAVVGLWADPDRAAQLGAAAQKRVRTLFNWERLAEIALAAYAAAGA